MQSQRTHNKRFAGIVFAGAGLLIASLAGQAHGQGVIINQRPDDRYVAFEAESFTKNPEAATGRDFDPFNDPSASGGVAMLNDDDAMGADGTSRDQIFYRIHFSQTGNYDLYHRSRQGSSAEGFATGDGNDGYAVYNDLVPDDGNDDFDSDFDSGEFNSVSADDTTYEYIQTEHDEEHATEEGEFGSNINDYSIPSVGTYEFAVRGLDDGLLLDRLIFTQNGEGIAGGPRFNFDEVSNSPTIPEPASLAVLGLGGGLVLLGRRRRKTSE